MKKTNKNRLIEERKAQKLFSGIRNFIRNNSVSLIKKSSSQNIVSKIVNGGSRVLQIVFLQGGKRFARRRTNAYVDEEIAQPTQPKPILEHSRNYKKKLLLSGLIFVILLLIPDIAFAAGVSEAQKFMNVLATGISWLLRVFYPLLWIVITFIGELMDNSMIFGEGMEEILLGMWRQIRNFVNIAFVIALLGIAFYNILGRTEGNYVLKTIMPKFVIALIAVNFSFLACKVVLDVSHMLTTAVAAIPGSVYEGTDIKCPPQYVVVEGANDTPKIEKKEDITDCKIRSVTINLGNAIKTITGEEPPKGESKEAKKKREAKYLLATEKDVKVTYEGKLTIKDIFDVKSIALYIGVNVLRITEIPEVSFQAGDLSTLTINGIFAIIFMLVYLVSFVAMFLVLLARVAVMWVAIVLSPVIALAWVLGDLFPMPEGKFNAKTMFIEHAFVPLKMMIPLTIGLMMVLSAQKIITIGKGMEGIFQGSQDGTLQIDVQALVAGIGDARLILWNLATVMIIWFGVFAAANKTVISESIITPLQQKLTAAAKFVAKAPTIIPWIPVKIPGKDEKMPLALADVGKIWGQLKYKYGEELPARRARAVAPDLFAGSPDSIADDIRKSKTPGEFIKTSEPVLVNKELGGLSQIQRAIALSSEVIKANKNAFQAGLGKARISEDAFFKDLNSKEGLNQDTLFQFLQGYKGVVESEKDKKETKDKVENADKSKIILEELKTAGGDDGKIKEVKNGLEKNTKVDKNDPIIKVLEAASNDEGQLKILALQLGKLNDIESAIKSITNANGDLKQAKVNLAAENIKKGTRTFNSETELNGYVKEHQLDRPKFIEKLKTDEKLKEKFNQELLTKLTDEAQDTGST